MHILTLLRIPSRWMPDYDAYLRSDKWRRKRAAVVERDGRCRLCGKRGGGYEVHHTSYRYIGREPLRDLVALCRECHKVVTVIEKPGYAKVMFYD